MASKVYFIGAGPGDPELLTLKGKRILSEADVIVYADSLVNPAFEVHFKEDAEVYKSAQMTLEETTLALKEAIESGKKAIRLHSGDPSVYGAISEQMAELDKLNIDYEVVPGVTSLFAAAAALKTELTIPELSQSIIITRTAGRTPVPPKEDLKLMASHRCAMGIYLSTTLSGKVQKELLEGGYTEETPIAIVYRASWPDQKILKTKLGSLAETISKAGFKGQALIITGDFLGEDKKNKKSKLYDKDFSHEFRK